MRKIKIEGTSIVITVRDEDVTSYLGSGLWVLEPEDGDETSTVDTSASKTKVIDSMQTPVTDTSAPIVEDAPAATDKGVSPEDEAPADPSTDAA